MWTRMREDMQAFKMAVEQFVRNRLIFEEECHYAIGLIFFIKMSVIFHAKLQNSA
jgi:hypothetical protein